MNINELGVNYSQLQTPTKKNLSQNGIFTFSQQCYFLFVILLQALLYIWQWNIMWSFHPIITGTAPVIITVLETAMLCSTFLLVAMTFDRFYSIIKPHKAASFNTIRRTKIIISLVIVSSIVFNIPHLFTSDHQGWQCLPYGKANRNVYGQMFYWVSCIVEFVIPFVSLLTMNSVIIHKLRIRSILTEKESKKSGRGDTVTRKSSDTQILIMLLIVTFGFLVLVTPAFILFLTFSTCVSAEVGCQTRTGVRRTNRLATATGSVAIRLTFTL